MLQRKYEGVTKEFYNFKNAIKYETGNSYNTQFIKETKLFLNII